ncbi:MAG TPA: translocation/assembly module TamB domain-containing protein [Dokdonella sp.]|uniref:translocation/assembly module TamB domain-containing protein n=1 Tax=Dokdonella sp. TaxID=2291710 RepID=UPI002D7E4276|nr:translocation/assembly module TamB domain-containing protein [Dokdonella sp.]HET9033588.1 translocation/assembly module TamB domain-containing protein [Dokdonella sp.]
MLRATAWLGLALVILLGGLLVWVFNSRSGADFVLARVQSALDQKLLVNHISGGLSGPLVLDGVRYLDPEAGVDAQIKHLSVDLGALALLAGRVELNDVVVDDVDVQLTTVAPSSDDDSTFSLNPPINIVINGLVLQRASIRKDGESIFVADRLDLKGGWTHDGLRVRKLVLRSPDGHVDLNGTLGIVGGYSGSGETNFTWRVGETDLAGVLKSRSDGKQTRIDLNLTKPTPASAVVTIEQTAKAAWNLQLDVPTFAAKAISPDSTLGQLAVHLNGTGDHAKGEISGSMTIEKHAVAIDPLRYALKDGVITIESMHLTSPESTGTLDLLGSVDTTVSPPRADLLASWQDVTLPADLVGQPLATHGELSIDGNVEAFAAKGTLALGPPDALADIDIDINGTTEAITLNTVRLKQAKGGLDASGTISLQPTLGWNIKATASQLDPGAFFAGWPGAIDFVLDTAGTQTAKGPNATLVLAQVGGSLHGRPLGGSADLRMKPGYVVDGNLELTSGNSRVRVEGNGGSQTDARIRFETASLADWLPDAGGKANGNIHVSGEWPKLDIDGDITGNDIAWQGARIDSMELVAKITNLAKPAGALTLKAENLSRGDTRFDTLLIEGDGNAASHQLNLVAKGTPASIELSMAGASKGGNWDGRMTSLLVDPAGRNLPNLELDQAAQMSWNGSRFDLAEACLISKPSTRERSTQGQLKPPVKAEQVAAESVKPRQPEVPARLCIGGSSDTDGSLAGKYQIEHLPLRLVGRLGAPDSPLLLRGEVKGSGDISRKRNGPISGNARLVSDKGELFYIDGGNKPLLSYSGFTINADLNDSSTTATLRAELDHDGRLEGNIALAPGQDGIQTINGEIKADLNSLAFLELLSSEVSNPRGKLSAHYAIAGTLDEPRLDGALTLDGFATEIPAMGLKLQSGNLSLRAVDAQRYVLEGSIQSGKGNLTVSGEGGLDSKEPMKFSIKGEDFLAADIPAARLVVSPDLSVERREDGIFVTGKLDIPSANVDLSKLPGGGASAVSPDVVIVDADQPEPGQSIPVTATVAVSLGDKVKLAGFGFDGSLSGTLVVSERPGRVTTGSGTLNAGGNYKAYGQDLKIETGRILFASSPIDNPGIDIRATRKIRTGNITAGLLVRGTAQVPVLTVFSDPTMEQSEALSYLVTGKPLSSLKSGEGDMLGTAARALGTAGGDLLAKSIGSKMGVDDIGVADNDALGGAAFTVGKYLSPKLYLSYGVGVFDPGEVVTLRYLFSHRWNFEAQNATTGSRAGFNYRFEK